MDKIRNMDRNWKFYRGDLEPHTRTSDWGGAKARGFQTGAAARGLDDSGWRSVDLPHDFVVEGDYTNLTHHEKQMTNIPEMESIDSRHFAGGCLEGGIAWYRKKFDLNLEDKDSRVYLFFDGVYRDCQVYLNEYYIGSHFSGYTSFWFDITDFVDEEQENLLAVRVDSTGREGWWYEGGGIYRHVRMEIRNPVHFAPSGIFVSSQANLEEKSAVVTVKSEIRNKLLTSADIKISLELGTEDANGVFESLGICQDCPMTLPAWEDGLAEQTVSMKDVVFWSIDHPSLYQVRMRILRDGAILDEEYVTFGIRKLRFDADTGFYLNGESVKIKGVCCHQDHAGVGIGMPDVVIEYRMRKIKEMGANAYRCAHHQQSRELLDICDRLGLLVMCETRRMSSAQEDLEELRTLVRRDRNHPSVFLWGIGNEEIFSQDRPETAKTTRTMKAEIQKLDPTRCVTSAVVCWNGKERFDTAEKYIPVTRYLDVMGFNYCQTAWDDYHARMPKQPILVTEIDSNSWTRGCYATDESVGQYYLLDPDNRRKCKNGNKAVKKDVAETAWAMIDARDFIAGAFIWTGFDYRGEPTPMAYPAVYTQFGVFDYCGFEKDNYYYYKSWWSPGEPVLHIFPHWNHRGCESEAFPVYCYSNLDEVELFVNDRSYGKKAVPRNGYPGWDDVVYVPGKLSAFGYKDGRLVMTDIRETTGAAASLSAEVYRSSVKKDDIAILNIELLDAYSRPVPDADTELHFEISGGRLVGTGNGNPGSHESEKLPVRRAFHGKCQLIVDTQGKKTIVKLYAQGLKDLTLSV